MGLLLGYTLTLIPISAEWLGIVPWTMNMHITSWPLSQKLQLISGLVALEYLALSTKRQVCIYYQLKSLIGWVIRIEDT